MPKKGKSIALLLLAAAAYAARARLASRTEPGTGSQQAAAEAAVPAAPAADPRPQSAQAPAPGADPLLDSLRDNPRMILDLAQDPALQQDTLSRIARSRDDRLIPALREILSQDDETSHQRLVTSLMVMMTPGANELLREIAASDRDEKVRASAGELVQRREADADQGGSLLRSIPEEAFNRVMEQENRNPERPSP